MIGFASAPIPSPPEKTILGLPQGLGAVSQTDLVDIKSCGVSRLTSSIVKYLYLLSPSKKIYVVPGFNSSYELASDIDTSSTRTPVLLM